MKPLSAMEAALLFVIGWVIFFRRKRRIKGRGAGGTMATSGSEIGRAQGSGGYKDLLKEGGRKCRVGSESTGSGRETQKYIPFFR
jgi:hypothetical protein